MGGSLQCFILFDGQRSALCVCMCVFLFSIQLYESVDLMFFRHNIIFTAPNLSIWWVKEKLKTISMGIHHFSLLSVPPAMFVVPMRRLSASVIGPYRGHCSTNTITSSWIWKKGREWAWAIYLLIHLWIPFKLPYNANSSQGHHYIKCTDFVSFISLWNSKQWMDIFNHRPLESFW